jgi:hypothetical protein
MNWNTFSNLSQRSLTAAPRWCPERLVIQELDMATIRYPLTSFAGDTLQAIEKLACAIAARLAALAIIGAAGVAVAGFIDYGPLAGELSSWSPLNAMGAVIGVAVFWIALLGAAKRPRNDRAEQFDIE